MLVKSYSFFPFTFEEIENKEILVNFVGDYLIVKVGTANAIVERKVQKGTALYKDLVANFFIYDEQFPNNLDIIATRYRTKKAFINDFTALHIFVLTLRCNQNCSYCQASAQSAEQSIYDISYDDLNYSIDLMFRSPSPSLTMEFQGGESTLVYDKFVYAIERTEKINESKQKHITYVLCTNSVDLSPELLSFCLKYKVLISTSLDGPDYLHNLNRGKNNSYQKVITGIFKARKVLGYDQVSALMTCSENSLNYPKEIIDNYIDNGFSNIFLRALNPYGLANDNEDWERYIDNFINFYKESLDYIIEINNSGIYFEESFSCIVLKKILTPFAVGFVDLQSPAGIINSVVVYNYDGKVYASDESRMLAEHDDYTFCLGKSSDLYHDLFYGEKVKTFAQVWNNECLAGCSDCAFQLFCGADPVRNYTMEDDLYGFRPDSLMCKKNKAIIKHLFSLIINRRKEVMPVFQSWIS